MAFAGLREKLIQRILMKILILIIFFLTVCTAQVDLYSWTDAGGVKHFSNTPPPDTYAQQAQKQEEIKSAPKTAEQKQFETNERNQQATIKSATLEQNYQNAIYRRNNTSYVLTTLTSEP